MCPGPPTASLILSSLLVFPNECYLSTLPSVVSSPRSLSLDPSFVNEKRSVCCFGCVCYSLSPPSRLPKCNMCYSGLCLSPSHHQTSTTTTTAATTSTTTSQPHFAFMCVIYSLSLQFLVLFTAPGFVCSI